MLLGENRNVRKRYNYKVWLVGFVGLILVVCLWVLVGNKKPMVAKYSSVINPVEKRNHKGQSIMGDNVININKVQNQYTYGKKSMELEKQQVNNKPGISENNKQLEGKNAMEKLPKNIDDKQLGRGDVIVDKWDKWIVVTTAQMPSNDLKTLNAIKGWKMVVVGDTKTQQEWKLEGAVYLDIDTQNKLSYKINDLIPHKKYIRKNIGYLYAIQHGAKYIYETDDDNRMVNLDIFHFKGDYHGLQVDTKDLILNPYSHFGQSTMWPRGYPLNYLGQHQPRIYRYYTGKMPVIQQGLVDGDTNIDALFRLTRKPTDVDVNITFDGGAPAIILPHGTYAPFNSQNTLFLYDGLWAMILPVSVTDKATDIYRSYWAQKLLELIGHKLIFIPPRAVHNRNNAHKFLHDAKEELANYFEMGRLCEFLKTWKCTNDNSFFECVRELTRDLVHEKFYAEIDYKLVDSWLDDLGSFGYKQPTMVGKHTINMSKSVMFFPLENPTCLPHEHEFSVPAHSTNIEKTYNHIQNYCGNYLAPKYINKFNNAYTFIDTLLVVTIYDSIKEVPFIDSVYKLYFPRILFCGKESVRNVVNLGVSYVQVNSPSLITCVQSAIQMGYNVNLLTHVTDREYLSVNVSMRNTNQRLSFAKILSENRNFVKADRGFLEKWMNMLAQKEQINQVVNSCTNGHGLFHISNGNFIPFLQVIRNCENNIKYCEEVFNALHCKMNPGITSQQSVNVKLFNFSNAVQNKKIYCDLLNNM